MSKFFVYCILWKRAEATSQGSTNMLFKFLLVLVKFGTALVPLGAVGTIFMFKGKVYFLEEFCVLQAHATLTWFATCLDSTLSFGYLFLFLLPVLDQVRLMGSSSVVPLHHTGATTGTAKLRVTAKRNLQISSVTMCSTFVYLTGICLTSEFTSGNDKALFPHLHWQNWTLYGASFDLAINSIGTMIMFKGLWTTEGKNGGTDSSKMKAVKDAYLQTDSVLAGAEGFSSKRREPLFPEDL